MKKILLFTIFILIYSCGENRSLQKTVEVVKDDSTFGEIVQQYPGEDYLTEKVSKDPHDQRFRHYFPSSNVSVIEDRASGVSTVEVKK